MEIQKTYIIIYLLAQNFYHFEYHIKFLLLLQNATTYHVYDIYNSATCGAFVLKK